MSEEKRKQKKVSRSDAEMKRREENRQYGDDVQILLTQPHTHTHTHKAHKHYLEFECVLCQALPLSPSKG
jgi:hypothetical protein